MLSETSLPPSSWSSHFDQGLHLYAERRIGKPQDIQGTCANSMIIKILKLKGISPPPTNKNKLNKNLSVIFYTPMHSSISRTENMRVTSYAYSRIALYGLKIYSYVPQNKKFQTGLG